MKKMSFGALQCNVPFHENSFRGVSYMCCWWLTAVAELCFTFSPAVFSASFCLLLAGFGPCVVFGQSGSTSGLSWVKPGVCRVAVAGNTGHSPCDIS